MNIEILTVGAEILEGRITDGNAAFLGRELTRRGHRVTRMRSVADEVDAIVEALRDTGRRTDAVVMTGGLGVTPDDVTRAALARLAPGGLVRDEAGARRLSRRYRRMERTMPSLVGDQSLLPAGARLLANPAGQAPGLVLEVNHFVVYALPGVPIEMRAIAQESVFPELGRGSVDGAWESKVLSLFGSGEAEVAERIAPLDLSSAGCDVAFLPRGHCLELVLKVRRPSPEEARRELAAASRRVRRRLGELVFAAGESTLEEVVGRLLTKHELTLAVAESLTGGLVGHLLTQVPGSSAYLDRVMVAYANRAKVQDLGVPWRLIRRHGAVSPEVAESMARGVKRISGAHLGLSTTGIAGPSGGSPEKPVGLTYIGVAAGRDCHVRRFVFPPPRGRVKRLAANTALNELRLLILDRQGRARHEAS